MTEITLLQFTEQVTTRARLVVDAELGVRKAPYTFHDRAVHVLEKTGLRHGDTVWRDENRTIRGELYSALCKAEGKACADAALASVDKTGNWLTSSKPISGRDVRKVLLAAEHCRQQKIRSNLSAMEEAGRTAFGQSLHESDRAATNGRADQHAARLWMHLEREVRSHPKFKSQVMEASDFDAAIKSARQKESAARTKAFQERYPGLSAYFQVDQTDQDCLQALRLQLDIDQTLKGEPSEFRKVAKTALARLEFTEPLLARMSYEPEGWALLERTLDAERGKIDVLRADLAGLSDNDWPKSNEGKALLTHLAADLEKREEMLLSKMHFIEDLRANDPLSQKTVAYSNLMWACAAMKISEQAAVQGEGKNTHDLMYNVHRKFSESLQAYSSASSDRIAMPATVSKKAVHPLTQGKADIVSFLRSELEQAGFTEKEIKKLTGKSALADARVRALNENGEWAPVKRQMIVTRDGVTRSYESRVIPGRFISEHFQRSYANDHLLGVSSGTRNEAHHARNLKVSDLVRVNPQTGKDEVMARVVGHGVMDMWKIGDPKERAKANRGGAKEVIEAAIGSNERFVEQVRKGPVAPIKVTHVSVNLTTPSDIREWPLARKKWSNHQEKTYTEAQFEAFESLTSAANDGNPVQFQIQDPDPSKNESIDVDVDLDVISFSFGINPLATGKYADLAGGWGGVYEHNKKMMVRFVGDLGVGEFGAVGRPPGGFIGSVVEELDASDPKQAELKRQIQEQTDIVRQMFTNESFRKGNGDPAKMGRHVLALQALAEQALAAAGSDHIATMSKNCKSDKDRGGVMDVEVKHLMITHDMGGEILPDTMLEPQDQENYYVVASASGQFENQRMNSGVGGSKEAGKLSHRIPNKVIREYLSGLGRFVSE